MKIFKFVVLFCLVSFPAQALTCKQVRDAVNQYGEWAVKYWARSNGYSDSQITEIRRLCLGRHSH